MGQTLYRDVFGDEIILVDSVRAMILIKHPETVDVIDQIDRVLAQPDEVHESIRDSRSILYYRFEDGILKGKWVVVVVKRIDQNFISTIYVTDQIKSGETLWTKTK